jgi:hypothetical protein
LEQGLVLPTVDKGVDDLSFSRVMTDVSQGLKGDEKAKLAMESPPTIQIPKNFFVNHLCLTETRLFGAACPCLLASFE